MIKNAHYALVLEKTCRRGESALIKHLYVHLIDSLLFYLFISSLYRQQISYPDGIFKIQSNMNARNWLLFDVTIFKLQCFDSENCCEQAKYHHFLLSICQNSAKMWVLMEHSNYFLIISVSSDVNRNWGHSQLLYLHFVPCWFLSIQ